MIELPNGEGVARSWLRQFTDLTALCGDRQYFEAPKQDRPTIPCIVFYRVGGSPDSHGKDYPRFVFECWGKNKFEASQLAVTLAGCIVDYRNGRTIDVAGGRVEDAEVNEGPREMGSLSWAKRYRLDATLTMRYA